MHGFCHMCALCFHSELWHMAEEVNSLRCCPGDSFLTQTVLYREFGLLVKQVLYFDRYVRLLAPELQVMEDSRVTLGSIGEDKSRAVPNTIDITLNN